jgi:hypothetical protein
MAPAVGIPYTPIAVSTYVPAGNPPLSMLLYPVAVLKAVKVKGILKVFED